MHLPKIMTTFSSLSLDCGLKFRLFGPTPYKSPDEDDKTVYRGHLRLITKLFDEYGVDSTKKMHAMRGSGARFLDSLGWVAHLQPTCTWLLA